MEKVQRKARSYFGLGSGLLGPRGQSGDRRPSISPVNQLSGGRGLHTELPSTTLETGKEERKESEEARLDLNTRPESNVVTKRQHQRQDKVVATLVTTKYDFTIKGSVFDLTSPGLISIMTKLK